MLTDTDLVSVCQTDPDIPLSMSAWQTNWQLTLTITLALIPTLTLTYRSNNWRNHYVNNSLFYANNILSNNRLILYVDINWVLFLIIIQILFPIHHFHEITWTQIQVCETRSTNEWLFWLVLSIVVVDINIQRIMRLESELIPNSSN